MYAVVKATGWRTECGTVSEFISMPTARRQLGTSVQNIVCTRHCRSSETGHLPSNTYHRRKPATLPALPPVSSVPTQGANGHTKSLRRQRRDGWQDEMLHANVSRKQHVRARPGETSTLHAKRRQNRRRRLAHHCHRQRIPLIVMKTKTLLGWQRLARPVSRGW